MNKIHWDGVDNSLEVDKLIFDFDGAEGGSFFITDTNDDNIIKLKIKEAEEFLRFVKFAKNKIETYQRSNL